MTARRGRSDALITAALLRRLRDHDRTREELLRVTTTAIDARRERVERVLADLERHGEVYTVPRGGDAEGEEVRLV